ncbi:hypothetical protein IQ255_09095 [Pleurocapsales cyanobacterium LEGE 10410]|nr:hypothetical protein [Pleurocapsales cyanobacterium LEGE 10410]
MKRFAIAIISTLFVAALPTVRASETAINYKTLDSTILIKGAETSPVNLVYLAHRGYFTEQGIPSFQALISAYSFRNINAEKLVQVGVETGRVSPNALNDRGYISAVESVLNTLKTK